MCLTFSCGRATFIYSMIEVVTYWKHYVFILTIKFLNMFTVSYLSPPTDIPSPPPPNPHPSHTSTNPSWTFIRPFLGIFHLTLHEKVNIVLPLIMKQTQKSWVYYMLNPYHPFNLYILTKSL